MAWHTWYHDTLIPGYHDTAYVPHPFPAVLVLRTGRRVPRTSRRRDRRIVVDPVNRADRVDRVDRASRASRANRANRANRVNRGDKWFSHLPSSHLPSPIPKRSLAFLSLLDLLAQSSHTQYAHRRETVSAQRGTDREPSVHKREREHLSAPLASICVIPGY